MFVTGKEAILFNCVKPIERIIHNAVQVHFDGVFAAKRPDSVAAAFVIAIDIVIHQKALDGISAPYPMVALDALDEYFAACQFQRVNRNIPDTVYFFVIAAKVS